MLAFISTFASVMHSIGSVLLALVILLFMITVHEFGHFVAGRLLKFQINEFAVGMGPKLLSKKSKKSGTEYSLRLLPLGGFCAFEGETDDVDNPKAFNNQKPWKRIIVLFAGAFFNFISALLICTILFLSYGETVVKVNNVYDYAPTINQQLENKIIYKINGKTVYMLDGLTRYLDEEMEIEVIDQNGNKQTISGVKLQNYVTPVVKLVNSQLTNSQGRAIVKNDTVYSIKYGDTTKYFSSANAFNTWLDEIDTQCVVTILDVDGRLHEYNLESGSVLKSAINIEEQSYTGVGMAISYESYKFGFWQSMGRVVPFCGETALMVLRTLGGMITGVIGLDQVGGPISTIGMTSQIVQTGFENVLLLIVLISVNLAVFNLLPVPALDGCQIVFTLIEWIAKKPINRKVQGWINGIGLVLLLGFAILVDLLKL